MSAEPFVSMVDRIPPNNLEAEMALLGSVLVDPKLMPRVAAIARESDYYASLHAAVWASVSALYKKAAPIDKIALAEELRSRGMLDKVGGLAFLSQLMETVPSAASAEYYAKIVREKAALRELIHAGAAITQMGYEGEDNVEGALTRALRTMQDVVDKSSPASRKPMNLLEASYALREHLTSGRGAMHPSPFPGLNKAIGGFMNGTITVLGGAPKMAKSFLAQTLAMWLAVTVAAPTGGCIPFFPCELGRTEQQMRNEQVFSTISSTTRQDKTWRPTEFDQERLAYAQSELGKMPIEMFDSFPRFSTEEIVVACRRLASERPLTAVFIDHIGFLDDVVNHGRDTKHDRVERSLAMLLEMARALNVPVFIVWHINRAGAKAQGDPSIYDLRDGGNVEGYAHNILFVQRDNWDRADGSQRDGKIIVAATRSGRHGIVRAHFDDVRGVWCDPDGYAFFDKRPTQAEFDMATTAEDHDLGEAADLFPVH